MRWLAVARKDFQNISQSYLVRGVVGVFVLIVLAIVAVPPLISSFRSSRVAFRATSQAAGTLVPIVALVAGYLAVAGERESGSIRILLSLPPSRRDVVLGKFVSRSGVVLAGILLAFVLGGIASLLVYGDLPLELVVWTTALTALLGVTFVGIAIGISAAVSARSRAAPLAIGFYILTVVVWSPLLFALRFILGGSLDPANRADWVIFLEVFPPSKIFGRLYSSMVGSLIPGGTTPGDAVYLTDWFLLLVLLAWLAVPLALGYWRFQRADLG